MKAVKIIGSILAVIVLIAAVTAIVNVNVVKSGVEYAKSFEKVQYENQLVPQKDADGYWTFNTDEDLNILQITDFHIGGGWLSADEDKKALNAVAAMITEEKPDLVVLTGDMVFPVPYSAGTLNNKNSTNMVISLMETLGVHYTACFGNHDTEVYSYYSREDISNVWGASDLKYSLYQPGPGYIDGYGNHVIKVKNSDGIVKNAYFFLDSHSYTDGDYLGILWKYDSIKESQINWYKKNVEAIDRANKAVDPQCPLFTSLAFFHIPLEEYEFAWNELRENGYKDTENAKLIRGGFHEKDETVYHGMHSEEFFETVHSLGSTKGIFVGHDHINNAVLEYKGVKLVYGNSIDYLAYAGIDKEGSQRGCTLITLTQDGELSVELSNYYQDKYQSKYEKEEVTMQWQ